MRSLRALLCTHTKQTNAAAKWASGSTDCGYRLLTPHGPKVAKFMALAKLSRVIHYNVVIMVNINVFAPPNLNDCG